MKIQEMLDNERETLNKMLAQENGEYDSQSILKQSKKVDKILNMYRKFILKSQNEFICF